METWRRENAKARESRNKKRDRKIKGEYEAIVRRKGGKGTEK